MYVCVIYLSLIPDLHLNYCLDVVHNKIIKLEKKVRTHFHKVVIMEICI